MSSSFTEFRGKGFWSTDTLLEVWLRVLSLQMEEDVAEPRWQHELRDTWLLYSNGRFMGCIAPCLDQYLTDADRIAKVLQASDHCIRALRDFGDYVPAEFLRTLGIQQLFTADLPIEWFELIACRFSALLRGELATDATTSPTLPATRHGERRDEGPQPRPARSLPRMGPPPA
jgi:hypothetical protein